MLCVQRVCRYGDPALRFAARNLALAKLAVFGDWGDCAGCSKQEQQLPLSPVPVYCTLREHVSHLCDHGQFA